jgi:hypothetical protein
MALHGITDIYTVCFSDYYNINSKFRNIVILETFVKKNNDLNKSCRYADNLFATLSYLKPLSKKII